MSNLIATRAAYGDALTQLGEINEKIVVLDADLSHATMTCKFAEKYPDRFFNAGIAEANMTCMAAGLSEMGFIPFISTFAIFGTGRAYEQVRNSICYPHSNVKLAMTHAGISLGGDGGSHETIEDIALMRVLPSMTVICPCDANETYKAVMAVSETDGPVYLRLSRMPSQVHGEMPFEIGKANLLKDGKDVVIFTCGTMVDSAFNASELLTVEGIDAAIVNMHTIKPIDKEVIKQYASKCKNIVTLEEHSVIGGLGDAVAEVLLEEGGYRIKKLGVQDKFGQSGTPDELIKYYRLDGVSVFEDIMKFLK
jgi:transketolase